MTACEDQAMGRLNDVDLTLSYSAEQEAELLPRAQQRLLALRLQLGGMMGDGQLGPPLAVLFEGWDASGKGGTIKRLVAPLDPRHVRVAQFAAPDDTERRHHFLWRFWPPLPGWGGMSVFDRTWYGRVLVERVEGFATKSERQRAYGEITNLERALAEEGMVLVKLFLHISSKEQLKRFKKRERDPLRRWKLTDEDWRNRELRPAYTRAINEMLKRTDHDHARWNVIAAESKEYARVTVVETVIRAIETGLRANGIEPVPTPKRRG
jgi:AMP-polyphosphate phosphotransferase